MKISDKVWLSSVFLRSIGGTHKHAEDCGQVMELVDNWLAVVKWLDGSINSINQNNLVLDENKTKEALDCEHKNLAPAVQIGYRRR